MAGIAFALLLAEGMLRLAQRGQPVQHPWLGAIYPGQTVVRTFGEGHSVAHWDADAVRSSPAAGQAAAPVLMVGDSFTEAMQVDDDETFAALAQQELARRGVSIRTINIGRGMHSPADYVALAPFYRAKFRPRWTVVQLDPYDLESDPFDSSKTHFVDEGARLRVVQVVPREPRWKQSLRPLRERSALLDRLIAKAGTYRQAAHMPPLFRAADASRNVETASDDPRWPAEQVLDEVRRAFDGRVTFFYLPLFEAEVPLTERRFDAWCAAARVDCINLRSTFPQFRAKGRAPFGFPNSSFGIGHLNEEGHRAAAGLVARALDDVRRRGLL